MDSAKPSLTEKLKSLGVKVGTAHLTPLEAGARPSDISSVVNGNYHSNALGDAFVAEETYGETYRHGHASLLISNPLAVISRWAKDSRIAELPLHKFIFLDTETSGLSGGTGTYAFLIGAGRFVDGQFLLKQFFMRDPAEEPALLEELSYFIAAGEALVTFNGKAFDAPLLATRYALHRIPLPFKDYAHLDLLPLARRLWRDRLPSRPLKYLEEHVLAFTRASEEVPGYEIPWLYFDYLRTRDASPLKGVFYHNAMDVVAMAALLAHVNEMLTNPYNGIVEHGLDFVAMGKLFEDLNLWDEAARLYERGLESELTESDFSVAAKRLSSLHKKRGDLDQALRLWERAASDGHLYAHVELAKYYEHRVKDTASALKWARKARKKLDKTDMPAYAKEHWVFEVDRRIERLERKAGL